jgi:hypothetical protein
MPKFADAEHVERFLNTRCELNPLAFTPSAALAEAYLAFRGNGANSRDRDLLWKNLSAKGFTRQTRRDGPNGRFRGYAGIALRA